MKLRDAFLQMEGIFINSWGEYQKLMDEFNLYRGKELDDETVIKVNALLHAIQEAYYDVLPVLTFIGERYKLANNAVYDYHRFIDQLKEAGATEYNNS